MDLHHLLLAGLPAHSLVVVLADLSFHPLSISASLATVVPWLR
jgi:hypothetical protein